MQKSISAKNSKKFVYYNEELVHKFKRNYLENYNDSEHAVKTKNAPFFMIFPNISFFSYDCNLLDWTFKGGGYFYGLISEKNFSFFFRKTSLLGVILCEKSIARIPEE